MTRLRTRYPTDITGVGVLRIFGCRVEGDNVRFDRRAIAIWIALDAVLILWHGVAGIGRPDPWHFFITSQVWTLYFSATVALILWAAHRMTQGFLDLTVPLDRMLTARGRASYDSWYRRASNPILQAASGLVIGAGAILALSIVASVTGPTGRLIVVPVSYVVIAVTGFIAGAAAYWAGAGAVLCWRLGTRGRLRLYPVQPAYTPGLEELSQLLLTSFLTGVLLVAALLFPILYSTAVVPTSSGIEALSVTRTLIVGVCAATLITVGILPQVRFSRAIRDARRATQTRLLRRMAADPAVWRGDRPSDLHEVYARVGDSPTSTLGAGNAVQITVGIAAALLPFVVSAVLQLA